MSGETIAGFGFAIVSAVVGYAVNWARRTNTRLSDVEQKQAVHDANYVWIKESMGRTEGKIDLVVEHIVKESE